jgi:hypothetical protein
MKGSFCILAASVLGAMPATIQAGPFGLDMGMTAAQLGVSAKDQIAAGKYSTRKVPKPHSMFEAYVLQVAPSTGLCYIKAAGKNITVNVYGTELQAQFDDLKNRLAETYGQPQVREGLMPGSIWNDPKDFMMGLKLNERFLFALWKRSNGLNLPADLDYVILAGKSLGPNTGYVGVDYGFVNEKVCDAELKKREDGAL